MYGRREKGESSLVLSLLFSSLPIFPSQPHPNPSTFPGEEECHRNGWPSAGAECPAGRYRTPLLPCPSSLYSNPFSDILLCHVLPALMNNFDSGESDGWLMDEYGAEAVSVSFSPFTLSLSLGCCVVNVSAIYLASTPLSSPLFSLSLLSSPSLSPFRVYALHLLSEERGEDERERKESRRERNGERKRGERGGDSALSLPFLSLFFIFYPSLPTPISSHFSSSFSLLQ